MNNLKPERQKMVLQCLINGTSIRGAERITGVHRDTIMRLSVKAGQKCEQFMTTEIKQLNCKRIQLDEIWGFVGKKQRRLTENDNRSEMGDFWTFVALDADTRLVPAYKIGKRTLDTTISFLTDLSNRLANRVQLSSDAMPAYIDAIDRVFGANVDYAQIVKSYEAEPIGPGRYSPPKVVSVSRTPQFGNPDLRYISTSYVERNNLLMRMSIRRLTRLTDAFSQKLENFQAAIALYFGYYNFCRLHESLKATPAMAAGITNRILDIEEILSF